jgi:SAM-dependent methyltransferase
MLSSTIRRVRETRVSTAQDRHHVCEGVLNHLPAPKVYGHFIRCVAVRWRYRMLIMALVIALSPVLMLRTLSAGYASMVLVALLFIWDAYARRCRLWIRYETEHVLLRRILSSETVESVYANARDENRMPSDANDLSFFGERPAVEANPVHYLRYLWVKRLLDEVRHPDGGRVLDLGCQYGLMTTLLDRPGHFVVATDLNPESLKSMRRLSRQLALVRADARALSFHPNSFDLINFTEVLEHLSDPRAALEEIMRVLRPGGVFILTTDNRHGLLWSDLVNPLCIGGKMLGLFFPKVLPPPALVWNNDALGLAFYHTNFSAHEIRMLIDGTGFVTVMRFSYAHLGEIHQLIMKVFPHWTESRMAGVLYRIDRIFNRIPIVRMLGTHWLIVWKKAESPPIGLAGSRSEGESSSATRCRILSR